MATKEEARTFYTPPMTNPKFDVSQSIKESYRPRLSVTQEDLHESCNAGGCGGHHVDLSKEEIDQEVNSIECLPMDLSKLIDLFINDLKQPKYVKPLTIMQLSSLFQSFYLKFDKASFNYLSGNGPNASVGSQPTFLAARETLSSGLSGIFARSRSGSGSSLRRGRRSSSLFSSDSSNVTPMLSPEEIQKQLKINELNNLKIDKFMALCERDVFRRILEVGTSVGSPSKEAIVTRASTQRNTFRVTNLFRNSPEFIEYDKLLDEKLQCLSKLASHGKVEMVEFLRLPDRVPSEDSIDRIQELLQNLVCHTIAPCEKVAALLKIHESMMFSQEMSNDDFLSQLVYYIITATPRNIFLNAQFIRLFRNKKKLVEQELYALTNLEAALVFIEGLTLNDFPPALQEQLSGSEKETLEVPISSKVVLPGPLKSVGSAATISVDSSMHDGHPEAVRSNSYDGLRYAFDSSLRNIFGKIRSYTPPVQPINLPRSSSQLSLETDKKSSSSPTRNSDASSPLPEGWKKFKERKFEDLKVGELKEVFDIYQKLVV